MPHQSNLTQTLENLVTSDKMVELYLSGLNASEVARAANRTKQTVLYHLRKHNIGIKSSAEIVGRLFAARKIITRERGPWKRVDTR